MTIDLSEPIKARTPILRRRKLGEKYQGLLIDLPHQREQRDDKGNPKFKDNGRPALELIVTLLTVRSTMVAGIGDDEAPPQRGEIVRIILKGGGWGQWIDADRALPGRQVGDVVTIKSVYGQAYSAQASLVGNRITDQAEITAAKERGRSVGIYGDLTIARIDTAGIDGWQELQTMAETAHHAANTQPATQLTPAPTEDITAIFGGSDDEF